MKKIIIGQILLLSALIIQAQTPIPAEPQTRPIAIKGATAHLGDGNVIENSLIAFSEGKITLVTEESAHTPEGYEVIDAAGHHIYPGFILCNSQIGLTEVSSIRAMRDFAERGSINPNIRSVISYNTDSEFVPSLRFNGILIAESVPSSGLISGSSSVMEMDGWNWEDAAHSMDIGIHMYWPNRVKRDFDFSTYTIKENPNENYQKDIGQLKAIFEDAKAYAAQSDRESNLKLEALQGLLDGKRILFIHATTAKEIVESIHFAQEMGVEKITMHTGLDGLPAASFLAEHEIPVILPPTHLLPARPDQDIDLPYRLPFLMQEAGVNVSLSHGGGPANARNLPFYAGTAVAYGMDKEEALKTLTLNPAEALGVADRLGSLSVGKDATLFISRGDALDIRGNNLSYAFIRGKKLDLFGKQQELFERYSNKYGH